MQQEFRGKKKHSHPDDYDDQRAARRRHDEQQVRKTLCGRHRLGFMVFLIHNDILLKL